MLTRNCGDWNSALALCLQYLAKLHQVTPTSTHPRTGTPSRSACANLFALRLISIGDNLLDLANYPSQSCNFSFSKSQFILRLFGGTV